MPKWSVTLSGDLTALRALVALGVGVTEEGDAFVLRSPDLDALDDAGAVHQRAVERVEVFKGLSRIMAGDTKPRAIDVGGLAREDGGRRDYFLVCGTGEYTIQGSRADLKGPGDPPTSQYPAWAALADRDGAVRQALRLFASEPSPVNLYRVFEVVRADAGGEDKIVQNGWTTKKQIGRFRHTMNSVAALGDEARHGVEPTTPPIDPMSISEARDFITHLLERWLASK
jgi:hypothetical protein